MHAWLLLLVVLATSSTLVQVASTEDPSEPLSPLPSVGTLTSVFHKNSSNIRSIPGRSVESTIDSSLGVVKGFDWSLVKRKVNKSSVVLSANNQLTLNKRYSRRVKMSSNEVKHQFANVYIKAGDSNRNPLVKKRESAVKSSLKENYENSEVQTYRRWNVERRRRRLHRRHRHSKSLHPSGEEIVKTRTMGHSKYASDSLDISFTEQSSHERTSTPAFWENDTQSFYAKTVLATAPPSVIDFQYLKDSKRTKSRKVVDALKSRHLTSEITEVKTELSTNVQNEVKKSLLSLLKMDRPPVIDRSKIVIPEIMTQLYARKNSLDWNYVARSFTHKRK